jgi:hypothetical protein
MKRIVVLALLALAGCTTNLPSVVKNVSMRSDGMFVVERCTIHGEYNMYVTDLTYKDCHKETLVRAAKRAADDGEE